MVTLAAKSSPAADGCLNAFLASLSATMQTTPKLREAHFYDDAVGNASNVWTLTARDANDHHAIARVQCTVTASGRVLQLQREPL
ncbi:MAG: hypothetical protein ACRESY_07405 [Steroidobacteraceae bacterium]